MSRTRMLGLLAALVAVALPAQAGAATFGGIVVAKQASTGMLVLAGKNGAGLTVRVARAHVSLGDRIAFQGTRLGDGTIRAGGLKVVGHVRHAQVRGVIVRKLRASTQVATGRSVITIHHATRLLAAASDSGGPTVGQAADFTVGFGDDGLDQETVAALAPGSNVPIEGTVVTVSPFVVSIEGLPVTITVPAGMALPTTLTAGGRVELTVQPGTGNVFTLVSVDEAQNAQGDDEDGQGGAAPAAAPTTTTTTPGPLPPRTGEDGGRNGGGHDGGD